MDVKLGFIGAGNMARAMIGALVSSKVVSASDIMASAATDRTAQAVAQQYGIRTGIENRAVARESDIIVVAVKPHLYEGVLNEIKEDVTNKIVVSIAPGKTLAWLESILGEKAKVLRTMPNTPAMVGEGMTAICPNAEISQEELELLTQLLRTMGAVERVEERLFDAVTAVAGSAPAYVYMFIEALTDGAVQQGLPRAQAYRMASQAVLGSARMVLETGQHPGALKDAVCSPGGTTIDAVAVLEEKGMRAAVIQAMQAVAAKAAKM